MKVKITVGSATRELEVPGDLLTVPPSWSNDRRQDEASTRVAEAFAAAYRAEIAAVAERVRRRATEGAVRGGD